jgi:hypothetical protein
VSCALWENEISVAGGRKVVIYHLKCRQRLSLQNQPG